MMEMGTEVDTLLELILVFNCAWLFLQELLKWD